MNAQFDFEKYWQNKLSNSLESNVSTKMKDQIMKGSEKIDDNSCRRDTINWTKGVLERMEKMLPWEIEKRIMLDCACQYPKENLQDLKKLFAKNKNVNEIIDQLQLRFRDFLHSEIGLSEREIEKIIDKGWGLSGVREGDYIIATKIPKSGFLRVYLNEENKQKRREYYCHCPRIRDLMKDDNQIPEIYCYCGAGFYKGIWEEIFQMPVEVELRQSLLKGDEQCQVAIEIPEDFR